jgi:hypothetical protein
LNLAPFSPREKGARFKVPLPSGEGFRVRADLSYQRVDLVLQPRTVKNPE